MTAERRSSPTEGATTPARPRRAVRTLHKVLLVAAVLGLVGTVIVLEATPGSVLTERMVDGAPAHREYVIALVALIMLGFVALGMDIRDWL